MNNIESEVWKDVDGYEGKYQVSTLGRIKSLKRKRGSNKGFYIQEERLLRPGCDNKGYLTVVLHDKKPKTFKLHRLIAIAFINNVENKPQINHKDGNKKNNNVNNLEWVTSRENQIHAIENELHIMLKGERHPLYKKGHSKKTKEKISNSKIGKYKGHKNGNAKKVKCITTNEVFDCIKYGAEKYGISSSTISSCCRGKIKSAGKNNETGEKLTWKYI